MKLLRNSVFFLLSLATLSGCLNKNSGQSEIIRKVKVETVCRADSILVKNYPGITKEAGEVNLAFRVAGPIQKIQIKEGDYVQAGQMVAQIDPRDYEIQLEAAQAQYDQVKAEADRVIELHNRESVAGNDYDKAVSGLKMVTTQLKHAKDQLNDTKLLAPVSGYIQKVNFREKELIDTGMPLASLIDVGHYQVEVEIPVSLYIKRKNIVSFSGNQPDLSEKNFPLQLLSYSKKANNNQLYKLQLGVKPADLPGLAPGMDVLVKISYTNDAEPLACVPLNALFNRNGKTYVWIYQPDETVKMREVVTDKLTGDGRIRIKEGLQVKEQVVVAGVNSLNENEKVKLLEPVSETNVGGLM
ncbi:RND family efflux transporter, MFP subunit [Mariniphaga anaerophila]|uniref:RND family efflux transporter, MFP subunit n=1 Tax=Mariniphaga anaerophila TaxID=1484053 RepID=A0A1M4YHY9_9BACT|nr:efflux RND transporter periplasmic adaptor subunit [Mariniphaga anaerophila]SHF05066.1 RND family efflux transporter, MFP subunit [Mariniphaga anaerophila]